MWWRGLVLLPLSWPSSIPLTSVVAMSTSTDTWRAHSRRALLTNWQVKQQPLLIGYAHNVQSGKGEQAIKDGANVIIWSFLQFDVIARMVPSDDGSMDQQYMGVIQTDLDLKGIRVLRDKYPNVIHLAAFGGWNGPHPPLVTTSNNNTYGKEWCHVFMRFNGDNGYLFDGIDLDYEGHDDRNAPTSTFTIETLDIMADLSTEARNNYDMIVSMAPAESYLDATTDPGSIDSEFSLRLDFPPRAWTSSRYATSQDRQVINSVGFSHAGRQCYAYVLAKAGVDTFDWISIQLYEAYSTFAHDLSRRNIDARDALMMRLDGFMRGYTVTNVPLLSSNIYTVQIPISKLVLGVANRWADGFKFCKVDPISLLHAYTFSWTKYGKSFLGIMFWTVEEEGSDSESRLMYQLANTFNNFSLSDPSKEC